ncbi:MAG: tyrosine-type recombinase/integrase [Syntrophaceae bacterium]|nr:tyrosine-type recombinase/integrase [Syntrophaceae bacterium]
MTLTDLTARKLKPKNARYEAPDDDGLAIVVLPSGKKSWTFRYTFEKKQKRMTLGKYPAVSLSDARAKQALAMQDIEQGIDPATKVIEEKRKRITAPTFNDLLDEFWNIELKNKPTAADQKRLVTKDVLPSWEKRKVNAITRRDAVLIIDEVRERAPITANRLQTVLVRMFNFASERGIIEFSPLAGLRHTKEPARSRVLTNDEIKKLWIALDLKNTAIDMYAGTKLALLMILLSGQRPGEVCGMRWDEIKEDKWIIPESKTKNREMQEVPLTKMMIDIIDQARTFSSKSQFVFTSPRSPLYNFKKPMKAKPKDDDLCLSRLALSRALQRHISSIGIALPFTPHDLRRTLRTRLAALGVSDIVAERVLGHKLQGILAIYNRHDYATEKRQALDRWQTSLCEIVGLSEAKQNIIPFEVHNA